MEETKNDTKEKHSLWYHIKMYLIGMGVYLGISLVIGLFFIQHFRHFWISHNKAPLTEYTIKGTTDDLKTSHEIDSRGKSYTDETYTYYLKLDVNGKIYKVETGEDLYDRVNKEKPTHLDMEEAEFYYDSFMDKVFLGGYYSDAYYVFLGGFVVLFIILFVYLPISQRKVYFSD